MTAKRKAQIKGFNYGMITIVFVLFIDKIVLDESIATWIADDYELFLWIILGLVAIGSGVQVAEKQAITDEQLNEIDKKNKKD